MMRRHLSSGDAIPVTMQEYQELEGVAFEWEGWEVREDRGYFPYESGVGRGGVLTVRSRQEKELAKGSGLLMLV